MAKKPLRARSRGSAKFIAIGCAVALIFVILVGVLLFFKIRRGARELGAKMVEGPILAILNQSELPEEETQPVEQVLRGFAQEVRDGKVSVKEYMSVIQELTERGGAVRIGAAFLGQKFKAKYLAPSALPAADKKDAAVTISRFAHGIIDGKIGAEEAESIRDVVSDTTEVTQPDGRTTSQTTYKDSLSDEDLKKCLEIMKQKADDAEIEDREFKIDLAAELKSVIEKGRAAAK